MTFRTSNLKSRVISIVIVVICFIEMNRFIILLFVILFIEFVIGYRDGNARFKLCCAKQKSGKITVIEVWK